LPKAITTVNLDVDLIDQVRASGVRNISKHIENLMKRDLAGLTQVGKSEQRNVHKMIDQLNDVEKEWFVYLKRVGGL
jgi:hypothetical protein